MASKQSKTRRGRKARTHKGRRHRGGGWGFTGPSSIPGTPGTVSNPQVFTGIGDCRAVKPGYDIPYSQYSASFKGLPGMNGGKRSRKQRGGRYGFFPESASTVNPGAWWAATYGPVQRIACEGGSQNPLNPTHTGSTAPPGAASPNYYLNPGKGLMSGGAQQLAPATVGVGNVDSMYYYAPTAGYANTASTWKDSVGAPVQIQVPFAARAMNQACLSTGGHPPLTGALQKGGKRTRKQRGGFGLGNIPLIGSFFKSKNANTLNAKVGNAYAATNTSIGLPPPPRITSNNRQTGEPEEKNVVTPVLPPLTPTSSGNGTNKKPNNGTLVMGGGKRKGKKSRKHRKHHRKH